MLITSWIDYIAPDFLSIAKQSGVLYFLILLEKVDSASLQISLSSEPNQRLMVGKSYSHGKTPDEHFEFLLRPNDEGMVFYTVA